MATQENQHEVDYEFTPGQQRLAVEGVRSSYRFPKPERLERAHQEDIALPRPTESDRVVELFV